MKKLMAIFCLLLLAGAGCFGKGKPAEEIPVREVAQFEDGGTYKSLDYGFMFEYPEGIDVQRRSASQLDKEYLGFQTKFFASVRDETQGEDLVSIAFIYALDKEVSLDSFKEAVVKNDPEHTEIVGTETYKQGNLEITKVTNTTALGKDKTHYLFWKGENLILVSQFVGQDEVFIPVMASFQELIEEE